MKGNMLGCDIQDHDYENAKREGRARYTCPKCGRDITLELVLMEQAKTPSTEPNQ